MKIRLTKATLLSVLVMASALIAPTENSASVKANCVVATGVAALVAGYTLVRNMREKRAIEAFEALIKQEMKERRPRVYKNEPFYSKLYTGERNTHADYFVEADDARLSKAFLHEFNAVKKRAIESKAAQEYRKALKECPLLTVTKQIPYTYLENGYQITRYRTVWLPGIQGLLSLWG